MNHGNEPQARPALGDWGTSRLRLWLIEHGEVAATLEGPGIGALTNSPGDTLAALVAPWRASSEPLHIVLSGMAGSRTGLLETEYIPTAADFRRWSQATR